LAITVVLTLALGIGANAAIFTLVRGVLLRPLVNRDEDRLIYIAERAWDRHPERQLLGARNSGSALRGENLSEIGDFSTIGFTMVAWAIPAKCAPELSGLLF